jgi:transglutaminase-like putative cysteine protease
VIEDSGLPDAVVPDAIHHPVDELPEDILFYLLGSRYCETRLLTPMAWELFGQTEPGWARVQAIVDYVHNRIAFGYEHACATRTSAQAHEDRPGVCRDFGHLTGFRVATEEIVNQSELRLDLRRA